MQCKCLQRVQLLQQLSEHECKFKFNDRICSHSSAVWCKKTYLFLAFALSYYFFFFLFEPIQCTFLTHISWYTHSLSAVIEILIGQAFLFFFFVFFCPLTHKSPLIKMFKSAPASRKSDPCKLRGTLVNPVEFAIIHTRYVSLPYVRDPPLHSWAEVSGAWYTDRMQNIYVCYVFCLCP